MILGFNTFLPDGYKIELPEDDSGKPQTPVFVTPVGGRRQIGAPLIPASSHDGSKPRNILPQQAVKTEQNYGIFKSPPTGSEKKPVKPKDSMDEKESNRGEAHQQPASMAMSPYRMGAPVLAQNQGLGVTTHPAPMGKEAEAISTSALSKLTDASHDRHAKVAAHPATISAKPTVISPYNESQALGAPFHRPKPKPG